MHNFIAYVWKGGDFLKSYWENDNLLWWFFTNLLHVQNACMTVIFKTLKGEFDQVNFSHTWTQKRQIPKLSRANCITMQLTVGAWTHEPDWMALLRWLLSRYCMKKASLEPPGLYRDWKQCACSLFGSFTGLPGRCDYLEKFQPGF